MVKTTVNIEDEVYRRLVKEAVERYGNTKSFSKLINEKLKRRETETSKSRVKERSNIVERSFGIWKMKESSKMYVRKIRDEEEGRLKKMGL